MKESMRTSSGAVIPRMTAEQAEARSYLTMSLLDKMHLMPVGDPVAYSAAADGSPIYYFDPCRVREAPPENWYIPDEADLIQPMRLENGTLIGRMSTRRAAELGYYTRERLAQMHYDVPPEPAAYTLRGDRSVIYFYDKSAAVRQPLMCVRCGREVRYRRKLCRACFEADLAQRRAEGDAHRNAEYHMQRERVLFFDLELTGVYEHDEIISVSIMNGAGEMLMNTLVHPTHKKRWKQTEKIHGITPEMVADAPTHSELAPRIRGLFDAADVLIAYGISTDYAHIKYIYATPAERNALRAKTRCAAAEFVRYLQEHHPDLTHASLSDAMQVLQVEWDGVAHTSVADTIACAKVWERLFPHYYED